MSQAGQFAFGTGNLPIETLTGDSGGAVSPNGASNITLAGGTNITTVGNPGTNTIAFNLDDSLQLPVTVADGSAGVIALGATALPGGYVTDRFIHNFGTSNAFYGSQAGNMTLTAVASVGVGQQALEDLTSGGSNTAVGAFAGTALTSGLENTCIGRSSGLNLTTGDNNILIGMDAGISYTTEDDNICISNGGTVADANTIRIGTQGAGSGQQDTTFIAGIYQSAVGATNEFVIVDNNGQLGSESGSFALNWSEETVDPVAMAVNFGYIANVGAGLTLTLPAVAAVGDKVAVVGKNAGGWTIAQNAGQTMHVVGSSTTTGVGGSLASSAQFDSIELICITANTDFVARNMTGNITIV